MRLVILLVVLVLVFYITNSLVEGGFLHAFWLFPLGQNYETTFPELPVSETWDSDPVPRIIHQTAPSDKTRWNPVWERCQKTWHKHFPDYQYMFWSDEDLDEFIRTKYSWFYPTFKAYDKNIKRIDSARYFILYEYGGIYADMDYECIKNFESQLPPGKVSIAESRLKEYAFIAEEYQNALMTSPAKHPFWNHVYKVLEKNKNINDVIFATGPNVIKEAVYKCSSELFHGLSHAEFTEGTKWAKHHGTSMWIENNFLREVGRFIYSLW